MSIRRFFREKQIGKYIQAYLGFIVLNYVICLAPIGASYYFPTRDTIIPSFLAYCFTLFAVTVYSFMYFKKEDVGGIISSNLWIIIAWGLMFAYIITFVLYNSLNDVRAALNRDIGTTYAVALIPALVIPLVLSVPVIRLQVAEDKPKQVINTITKSESEGNNVINEINRRGIR